jgi:uncharacterized protein (TIGR03083 family)
MTGVADHYRAARRRVTELVLTLDDADLSRPVPACPGWTVHDVVAHVTGIPDDALNGRMDGVATPPWTAAQVERGRSVPTFDLLDRWTEQAATFESLPLPPQAVIDLTTHEQDIRGAVGRPGAREAIELRWSFELLAERAVGAVPGLRIEVEDTSFGPDAPTSVLRGDRFDLFRAMMGRRSSAQLRALGWSGTPVDDVEAVTVFGPAVADVIE